MGGAGATNALNLNAYHLLTSVPPEELGRFKVKGRHAGRVELQEDSSRSNAGAVILRRKAWMFESRWTPHPRRRRFRARLRRVFHWKRWRRDRQKRSRASQRFDINDDDLFDEDRERWEEEGIPDVYSDQSGTSDGDAGEKLSSPAIPITIGKSRANDEQKDVLEKVDTADRKTAPLDDPFVVPHRSFPRQFSLDFSEHLDECSLRKLPKLKKSGDVRVRDLPRGVPLRPVNMQKGAHDFLSISLEDLTESSNSSSESLRRSSGEHSSTEEPGTKVGVISVLRAGTHERRFTNETSPVSSIRTSDASSDIAYTVQVQREIKQSRLEESVGKDHLTGAKVTSNVSDTTVACAAKKCSSIEPLSAIQEDTAARTVSMYNDDFITFSCDARQPKKIFKLRSLHEKSGPRKKGPRESTQLTPSGVIRRFFRKN